MTDKQDQKDKVHNVFKKYIVENNIGNTMYVKAYADIVGVTFNYRYDLRNLKRGGNIPLSHLAVFCEFLTDSQKSELFKELSNIDFFGGNNK